MAEKSVREVVVYRTKGDIRLEVLTESENVWLNRHQLAVMFGRDVKTIGKHIANALKEELSGFPVVAKFATTAADTCWIPLCLRCRISETKLGFIREHVQGII